MQKAPRRRDRWRRALAFVLLSLVSRATDSRADCPIVAPQPLQDYAVQCQYIRLTWLPVGTATRYIVYKRNWDGTEPPISEWTFVTSTPNTYYQVATSSLTQGAAIDYKIGAVNDNDATCQDANGNPVFSISYRVGVTVPYLPTNPTGVSASSGANSQVVVHWTVVNSNNSRTYIYRDAETNPFTYVTYGNGQASFTGTCGQHTYYVQTATPDDCRSPKVPTNPITTSPTTAVLTAPAAGATISTPDVALSWTASCATSYNLQIASDANFANVVVNATPTNPSYTWTGASFGTFYWRVQSTNAGGTASWSTSRSFVHPLSITVTAPNGGENFVGGSSTNITWTTSGALSGVNIDYSANGGTSWTPVVANTPNTLSYAWTVPNGATSAGRVRVSASGYSDMSDANFSVVPVSLGSAQGAPDGAGGAFMVWSDNRSGNYDIYASRVDANGAPVAGWTAAGTQICNAPGDQVKPRAVSDNMGGMYVVWEDYRTGSSSDPQSYDIYAQRVTSTGAIASGWTLAGTPVVSGLGCQRGPAIGVDGFSGVFIAWEDNRTPGGRPYAQRLTSTGSPVWAVNGVKVAELSYYVNEPDDRIQIASDGAGGAVVAFRDYYGELFAQRLAAATGAPQWTSDPIYATLHLDSHGLQPSLVANGPGGYYVAYMSYVNQGTISPTNVNVVRFDNSGTIFGPWVACGATGDQAYPRAVSDGAGGVLVSWLDGRTSGTLNTPDLYATRLDATGALSGSCWSANGNLVSGGPGVRSAMTLAPDGRSGGVLVYSHNNDLRARAVLSDGSTGSEATLYSPGGYTGPASAVQGNQGNVVAVWVDQAGSYTTAAHAGHVTVPPLSVAGISDVAVTAIGSTGVVLGWTIPADHPVYGPVVMFDLRWGATTITEGNFNNLTSQFLTSPGAGPGEPQCAAPWGMARCTNYQFAVRFQYACGVWSSISNVASAKTRCTGWTIGDCPSGLITTRPGESEEAPPPLAVELSAPVPNPSAGNARFSFGIPASKDGTSYELAIYDITGRRVALVDRGIARPGHETRAWDGRAVDGHVLRAGMYFARLTVGGETRTRTVLLAR